MAGEFELIKRYFAPLSGPAGLGLLDDAALYQPSPNYELVFTKDMLIEGVHFFPDTPAELLAEKVLAVNLSDLAAKGAEPLYYWLGMALPRSVSEGWVGKFSSGLKSYQEQHGVQLAGGDTTACLGAMVFSVTMMGQTPTGKMLPRSGAKVGDGLYVTGTIGDAALGLLCFQENDSRYPFLTDRYLRPQARLSVGLSLRGIASACADVSDGLLADAGHVMTSSNVGLRIESARIPVSGEAQAYMKKLMIPQTRLWSGGDDYELIFTAPANKQDEISAIADKAGVQITRIGSVVQQKGLQLLDDSGQLVHIAETGYQHFK